MLALVNVLAEEATTINPVVPDDPGELFWGVVSFFVLWILLRYVCLPPLMKIREERAAKAQADLEAASTAETQTEQVRRDYDTTLAEARTQAGRIIEEARSAADAQRTDAVRQADAEVAELRAAEMTAIDAARSEALAAIRSDVGDLATSAASAVLGADLDPSSTRATVDAYVDSTTKR